MTSIWVFQKRTACDLCSAKETDTNLTHIGRKAAAREAEAAVGEASGMTQEMKHEGKGRKK